VGKGSNLLVRDGGIPGVVIFLEGRLAEVRECGKNNQVLLAGGGATLADLLNTCKAKGLSGLEFLAGIPGTVGGAVVMNAGAFGGEIGNRVRKLRIITGEGEMIDRDRSETRFSYRKSSIPEDAIVIEVSFQLERSESEIVGENMGDCLKRRKKSQPLAFPSGGSVFKNPPGDHAGRLIEKAGLKGKKIGGALISPKHANYIVNTGDAGAEDVLALMALARERVRRETGIELEPEIKVVGRRT
jgi:UDP-N-acetylmuramate dehydrogenase